MASKSPIYEDTSLAQFRPGPHLSLMDHCTPSLGSLPPLFPSPASIPHMACYNGLLKTGMDLLKLQRIKLKLQVQGPISGISNISLHPQLPIFTLPTTLNLECSPAMSCLSPPLYLCPDCPLPLHCSLPAGKNPQTHVVG